MGGIMKNPRARHHKQRAEVRNIPAGAEVAVEDWEVLGVFVNVIVRYGRREARGLVARARCAFASHPVPGPNMRPEAWAPGTYTCPCGQVQWVFAENGDVYRAERPSW